MDRCKTTVRPHEKKGYEIVLAGNCGKTVDEIMKNLGPYGQQYLKRRLVFSKRETGASPTSDSPSN